LTCLENAFHFQQAGYDEIESLPLGTASKDNEREGEEGGGIQGWEWD
jgi:hypothetical protein